MAKGMWDEVKSLYMKNTIENCLYLKQIFYMLRMAKGRKGNFGSLMKLGAIIWKLAKSGNQILGRKGNQVHGLNENRQPTRKEKLGFRNKSYEARATLSLSLSLSLSIYIYIYIYIYIHTHTHTYIRHQIK
ncbi:hypothetical protein ACH5RR_023558 [Cinchona calisaya]|uniref:Uncharacterized protein n=1 Tax=Cinchona calisaya TaxID=153742 RepID=A0ABD2ZCW8_9GENT